MNAPVLSRAEGAYPSIRGALTMRRAAEIVGPCRLTIRRQWDDDLPLAAWLMCNPSEGDGDEDDMTCRRVSHFTDQLGCGGWVGVNIWSLITPYPDRLWAMLKTGAYDSLMHIDNVRAVRAAGAEAQVHVAAFGVEPTRRYRSRVMDMLGIFSNDGASNLLCLGTSPEGWPLHPLARGKFAIPNDRRLSPWSWPL